MRLSTNTVFAQGARAILDQQSRLSELGNQLATGRRVLRPSDDPKAAAELLGVAQNDGINAQYAATRARARTLLSAQESQLDQLDTALDAAKQAVVRGANGTLADTDRSAIADQLDGIYASMLATANATDGEGNHLFAGNQSDVAAFTGTPGALVYNGDDGQHALQVGASRAMTVNTSGQALFASVQPNAAYIATAADDNRGSAIYSALDVVAAGAADYGKDYVLRFDTSDSSGAVYTVSDADGRTVSSGTYRAGQPIALGDALRITVEGRPADGDRFTVARGAPADSRILDSLADAVSVLREPLDDSEAGRARLSNTLNRMNRQIDNAQGNVLTTRTTVGSKLAELDNLDIQGSAQATAYATQRSALGDADMVATISSFSLAKVALQAAQQTFNSVQQLSIFRLG